jgi:hypothetical protein
MAPRHKGAHVVDWQSWGRAMPCQGRSAKDFFTACYCPVSKVRATMKQRNFTQSREAAKLFLVFFASSAPLREKRNR